MSKPKTEEQKNKVSSVYLGDQGEILTTLQTFYPDLTLGKLLRISLERFADDNQLLMNNKLIANTEKYIHEVVDFLYTIETELTNGTLSENSVSIPTPSKDFLKEFSGINLEKISRKLALSFCEILLIGSKDFRKHFIVTCEKHDLEWDVLLEIDEDYKTIDEFKALKDYGKPGEYEELSKKEFIRHGHYEGYLDPDTMDSNFVSDYSVKDLMSGIGEEDCPLFHDHDLLTRLILLESFHTYHGKISSKSSDIKSVIRKLLKEIRHTYVNEFEQKEPVLLIDFSGSIKRHGRKLEYPVRIVSKGEYGSGIVGATQRTLEALKSRS